MEIAKAINRSSGQEEVLSVMGIKIIVKLSGVETSNASSVVEMDIPINGGPGIHIDTRWDESWYVVEGSFAFTIDDKKIEATTGGFAYAPKGVPHSFKNIGQTTGKILMTTVPAGVENFFRDAHQATLHGKPDKETMVAIQESHGIQSVH